MIAEPRSYRGVSCVRCCAPIPVSKTVVSLPEQIVQREAGARVFSARCKLCEYESVYTARHVQWFMGEPRRRNRTIGR